MLENHGLQPRYSGRDRRKYMSDFFLIIQMLRFRAACQLELHLLCYLCLGLPVKPISGKSFRVLAQPALMTFSVLAGT
jgi:hypothetical protein